MLKIYFMKSNSFKNKQTFFLNNDLKSIKQDSLKNLRIEFKKKIKQIKNVEIHLQEVFSMKLFFWLKFLEIF